MRWVAQVPQIKGGLLSACRPLTTRAWPGAANVRSTASVAGNDETTTGFLVRPRAYYGDYCR